ncbi:hypothetical protein [Massilia sp. GCM10023247]|uniref:hypothetical protein n=1 Tax=Massilia sp. GCM10023247 TaxID=3252643 RepID=UPI003609ECCF
MDSDNIQNVKRRPYWSFVAFLYSLLGWLLFEAWLVLLGAGLLLHIFAAIPGATLIMRSALRPEIDRINPAERKKSPATESRWGGVSCALLYVLGAFFGVLVLGGSLTLLGIVALSFIFFPWARLSFTRNHFAVSCAITMGGFASIIAIEHRFIETMFLPLAAWAFWSCACCALLFRAEQLQRVKREKNVAAKAVETEPAPIHFPG